MKATKKWSAGDDSEARIADLEEFVAGIRQWQKLEDQTIASCDRILAGSKNVLVTTIAGMVRSDSQKHKQILSLIDQTLEGTISLAPEDLASISELITSHVELEHTSIELGQREIQRSANFVISELLTYLLEDEQKHYRLMKQLDDFKRKLYPYA